MYATCDSFCKILPIIWYVASSSLLLDNITCHVSLSSNFPPNVMGVAGSSSLLHVRALLCYVMCVLCFAQVGKFHLTCAHMPRLMVAMQCVSMVGKATYFHKTFFWGLAFETPISTVFETLFWPFFYKPKICSLSGLSIHIFQKLLMPLNQTWQNKIEKRDALV